MTRSVETAVTRAQVLVAALTGFVLLLALGGAFLSPRYVLDSLVLPAGLLGVVSPVIGYRLYHWLRERVHATADAGSVHEAFVRASGLAVAAPALIAIGGIIVYVLSGKLPSLFGLPGTVLVAGAIWPTDEKLRMFQPDGRAS